MKIALVHDYLKEIGGAERVLMAFQEMFPRPQSILLINFLNIGVSLR